MLCQVNLAQNKVSHVMEETSVFWTSGLVFCSPFLKAVYFKEVITLAVHKLVPHVQTGAST
jgi:hypothetical protein